MHLHLTALVCLLLTACASTPKPALTSVEIKEIKPRYIDAEQLTRVSEYFTGQENTGNRVFLRTSPEAKSGYYFTLILDEKVRRLPKGTTIIGEFYAPEEVDLQRYTFTLPNRRPKTKEIFVGLTGDDWPGADAIPAAWRFTIKGPNGNTLGESQSFLWSL
ncbi:MAG: hypothetical protein GVY36_12540 [Verrucomicrobia bacterium]|jgi:hypothetical protein|nr:hypothetical protein [Verrucomicrobiota bacterium]